MICVLTITSNARAAATGTTLRPTGVAHSVIRKTIDMPKKDWWQHHIDRLQTWTWEPEELRQFIAPLIVKAEQRIFRAAVAKLGEYRNALVMANEKDASFYCGVDKALNLVYEMSQKKLTEPLISTESKAIKSRSRKCY